MDATTYLTELACLVGDERTLELIAEWFDDHPDEFDDFGAWAADITAPQPSPLMSR
jgi:hypothetical protein